MNDFCYLDFDQLEQEWWQDYSEDLPESETEQKHYCKRCNDRGCEWCYMLDPVRI